MLDAFIIEELRRRERDRRQQEERPRLELPLDDGQDRAHPPHRRDEKRDPKDSSIVVFEMLQPH